MKSSSVIAAAVLVGAAIAGPVVQLGCYQVSTGTTLKDTSIYNSIGHCPSKICANNAVSAMSAREKCYCGEEMPADSDKVSDDLCKLSCPGYPDDNCGGAKYFMFYDNGITTDIPKADASSSQSSGASASPTSSAKPSVVTAPAQTVVVTSSGKPTSSSEPAGGPSKAGIAAGVVIGVVAIAGIVGGLFLFMRNRKRRAIEEEHRRNAEINSFTKPPTSSGATSFNDTRLDPVMANRRMSDGSIADNQDYSRRILKVTNA